MTLSQATAASDNSAAEQWVLAVDAGGTKTSAWLAEVNRGGAFEVLGRGTSASANPLTVGVSAATRAIAEAIELAVGDGGRPATPVGRAVLSVAGATNPAIRDQLLDWARGREFAVQVAVVPDVLPVLAAGTEDCCGVALVAGTGSVALARESTGRTVRCGGWGYLLGDDGSGYAIGRAALRHALEQLESNHGISRLAERVLQQLEAKSVADVTSVIYQSSDPRAGIAALAPLVVKLAAETDETASAILDAAARDLAALVARAARAADLADQPFTAAASGGVIVSSLQLQERIRAKLARLEIPCELQIVEQPLVGCVRLAAREFAGLDVVWR